VASFESQAGSVDKQKSRVHARPQVHNMSSIQRWWAIHV